MSKLLHPDPEDALEGLLANGRQHLPVMDAKFVSHGGEKRLGCGRIEAKPF